MSGLSDGYAIIPNVVKGLLEDSDGYIWVGSWAEGVVKFDPVSGRIYGFPRIGKRNSAHTVFEDSKKNIWIGTWGEGVYRVKNDLYGRFVKWETYPYEQGKKNSLIDNVIYCFNEDKNNNSIWVGTRGGLSIIKEEEDGYSVENHYPNGDNNSLSYNEVNSIIRDKQGVIWLGMLGGGINFVKTDRPAFKNDRLKTLKERYYSNSIRSIFKDNSDNLWIGLGSIGLATKNLKTGEERFHSEIDVLKDLNLPTINKIISSRDCNTLWLCTYGQGIFEYDKKRRTAKKLYAVNNNDMEWRCVFDFVDDESGKYWMATKFGLLVYYPETKHVYDVGNNELINRCIVSNRFMVSIRDVFCLSKVKPYFPFF